MKHKTNLDKDSRKAIKREKRQKKIKNCENNFLVSTF